ncbi:leucyl/phenylalanyl-tRNA--protein transferase [Campylobacter sp. RM16190]|uniref:leucyl/phenylalanyl-tRNA--protein transferase n=1 Tax=Campylobacter sp. RM16190 TaxID=1705727 RepID=UPI001475F8FB
MEFSRIYNFPDPSLAPSNSPLCVGGDLSVEALLQAYNKGIFPWFLPHEPIYWWCPDPRAVLFPKDIRIQKSIKSALKKFNVKFDHDFEGFLQICKNERAAKEDTWLSDTIVEAYTALFEAGFAHSVEVYEDEKLIGGLYGLIFGKVFCGESMISLKTGASKVALIRLCEVLAKFDFMIDCQVMNDHLKFMGAQAMGRDEFLKKFKILKKEPSGFENFKGLENLL